MLNKVKQKLRNQKGLTLVELLAVVVILGIIAAIAVPAIGGIIENSKRDAAISNAIQVINSVNLAVTGGVDPSTIDAADDIADYINPFNDPFTKDPIDLDTIAINMADPKNPTVDMENFGCGTGSNNAATLADLTGSNARDACVAP